MRRVLAIALVVSACASAEPAVVVTTTAEPLPVIYNGGELEPGTTYRYPFYIHCGTEWLSDFNGSVWLTDDPIYDGIGVPPENLRQFYRNPSEQISPELWTHVTMIADSEIRLTLPDGSGESIYRPTDEEWPGCA